MTWFNAHALIFDMDGTIADSMPTHYAAWQEAARQYGFTFSHERFMALGGVPTRQTLRILCDEQGLNVPEEEVAIFKEQAVLRHLNAVAPIHPVLDIARWARQQECPIAIATGASAAVARVTLQTLGIEGWFGAVRTADDVQRYKPEPDVFLSAAEALGVAPQDCAAFEDTDIGLQAILAAGMQAFDVRERLPDIPA